MSTAFTNFGDAHRGSKEDAIQAIEGASITKVEGSTDYRLSIATEGDPTPGTSSSCSPTPRPEQSQVGTSDGLEPLAADGVQVSPEGNVIEAPGYTDPHHRRRPGPVRRTWPTSACPPTGARSSPPA